jgi:hypothetical protein
MKAKPVKYSNENKSYLESSPEEATHVQLEMEGHFPTRILPIRGRVHTGPTWEWNGDTENPTLSPSIKTWVDLPNGPHICHSFIRNGMAEYLPDSTHEFAGQTRPLLEVR